MQWRDVDLATEHANVAVWPKSGVNPIRGDARADYYHSMYFSRAVIGVNTSALIESAIVGRPVYSVMAAEFSATQDGTLHFQHLKTLDGGLLHTADTLAAHVGQLSALLANRVEHDEKARRFVETFVRPHGTDVAATPLLVGELERLASGPRPTRRVDTVADRAIRPLLVPAAVLATAMTTESEKFKSMVLHWTRPTRLRIRRTLSRIRYGARAFARGVEYGRRLARRSMRRLLFPVRWTFRRVRLIASLVVSRAGPRAESDRIS
jgi:hypothetical protein